MKLSISTILAVSFKLSVGVFGAAISPITAKPVRTEGPSITKSVLANVEANLSRFVPHMLSEAKVAELAAVMQGLRPAQAHGVPTAAVSDLFWDGSEVAAI
ncbi:hypothetical protein IWW57_003116 [Coemansia sp. S610]|uniref:Uncharacterized protein n=1 Tax=Coemansia linderi TaxID=2663919 RepID=A0ACC1KF16_9FUNG|nr:hypothetical protein LPJ60_004389 [Coemansia sp. RSA 2675]KAJ2011732.1 hypothetical protein GGI06_004416 [Coemansia sp. S85]KAJ2026214.1 hypothetical protein IWW57_003116 [Coemansia sp. S610]KAJ2382418.1 hypothetical protein H4S02_005757 [Coemansia sp. RSA 2611]KAJ2412626.1 hypothetical protein GGI10_003574 [Coemansia sp. RSA 2530]KAJ2692961.1 hypothetical protein H4218_006218 [Coemansia sp. IMI 209128]KAJ2788719.1 hypothetical protein GGI18_002798 [Coemansia linderi]